MVTESEQKTEMKMPPRLEGGFWVIYRAGIGGFWDGTGWVDDQRVAAQYAPAPSDDGDRADHDRDILRAAGHDCGVSYVAPPRLRNKSPMLPLPMDLSSPLGA